MAQTAAPAEGPLPGKGILKICKVAGQGVAVGTPFTFTANGQAFSVPAGPAPGGYCVIAGTYPERTNVSVQETVPAGYGVTSISVQRPDRLVSKAESSGKVSVAMGSGVTEVTYTDEKRTGYIEICKNGDVRGNFTFKLPDGRTITVPAGACSPALEVPAGSLTITELPNGTIPMTACSTLQPGRQLACNTTARTSTVLVVPGAISDMTIAMITNGRVAQQTGSLIVRKSVGNFSPGAAPALSFTIGGSCTPPGGMATPLAPTLSLTDKQSGTFAGLVLGSSCTVVETNPNVASAPCRWYTFYIPDQPVSVTDPPATVTVGNLYSCSTNRPGTTSLFIAKSFDHPTGKPEAPATFAGTVTCTDPATGQQSVHTFQIVAPAKGIEMNNLPVGQSCKVDEVVPPVTPSTFPNGCSYDPETYPFGDTLTIKPPPAANVTQIVNHYVCP